MERSDESPDKNERFNQDLLSRELDLELQCQEMQTTLVELEESRNRYASLYDFAPAAYISFNDKGCIDHINLAGASLLGLERWQLIGIPMSIFLDNENSCIFFEHLKSCKVVGQKMSAEFKIKPQNGPLLCTQIITILLKNITIGGTHYRSIITDITERRLIEKEMSRVERLNLIGEMAAGIAHEIRNPMTTVRGFLQSFLAKEQFDQYQSQLNLMITELDRANSIISEYLSLAKNRTLHRSPQNLNNIIEDLLPLLESDALLNGKWVITDCPFNMPDLLLDPQEMRQVIINIVRNGLEAMAPGGLLTIGTYIDGSQLNLYIKDQGSGISPAVLPKLGTPFITTKEKGTGLGLAICYNILHQHNAIIDITTDISGTTFLIKFPLPE